MGKIKVLSGILANQIAAGEVVERPASVIKELIENAIDAGAGRLQIDVELGGRRLIRISDDGHGMERDDAILAFERHATSKIRSLEDLSSIATLGFRGEALASIASVAKVEIVTKTESELIATKVAIEGGRLLDVADASRNAGSTITVRDLFYNTPARRKFMRSEATENFHLTNIVTHYALANPEISFTLTNNGREVIRAARAQNLRERAFQLFGAGLLESLLPVSGGRENIAEITGFISAPRERRTTRDAQYFFVNRRFVRDRTIAGGLLDGFRSVLPHGVYPVAFLFVEIPLEEIDVNVHPAKTEIRFRRSEAVKEVIAEAVRASLAGAGVIAAAADSEPTVDFSNRDDAEVAEPETVQQRIEFRVADETQIRTTYDYGAIDSERAEVEKIGEAHIAATAPKSEEIFGEAAAFESAAVLQTFVEGSPQPVRDKGAELPPLPPLNSAQSAVRVAADTEISSANIRVIAQLHESFIVASDEAGLLLIDQHVAHERILFDKFRSKEIEREVESQNLLLPETLDLTPAQSEAFDLVADYLNTIGFRVMKLSGRTIAIKAVPTDLRAAEIRNIFGEILNAVERDKRGGVKLTFQDEIAASLACRAAVKINMSLTTEKMQWMIDKLLQTSSPTTCPHGRPVILRLTMRDIERGFHRT